MRKVARVKFTKEDFKSHLVDFKRLVESDLRGYEYKKVTVNPTFHLPLRDDPKLGESLFESRVDYLLPKPNGFNKKDESTLKSAVDEILFEAGIPELKPSKKRSRPCEQRP